MVLAGGGAERFTRRAGAAGAAGVIVPDLPFGEAEAVGDALAAEGLAGVPLVAPTTPAERRAGICAAARGFVYVVSDVGTTGERAALPDGLAKLVEAVKREARVPAAVGFGISSPKQAGEAGKVADGVIIGSRLVRLAADGDPRAPERIAEFLRAAGEELGSAR
jgi:tryptophan synthase alpha chain